MDYTFFSIQKNEIKMKDIENYYEKQIDHYFKILNNQLNDKQNN